MLPLGERDASVVRTRQKSSAIIAALGEICGLAQRIVRAGKWAVMVDL